MKNSTDVTLNLLSNVIDDSNDETNISLLLLTDILRKALMNN